MAASSADAEDPTSRVCMEAPAEVLSVSRRRCGKTFGAGKSEPGCQADSANRNRDADRAGREEEEKGYRNRRELHRSRDSRDRGRQQADPGGGGKRSAHAVPCARNQVKICGKMSKGTVESRLGTGRRLRTFMGVAAKAWCSTCCAAGPSVMISAVVENAEDVVEQLPTFIEKYNARRLHSSLGCLSPNSTRSSTPGRRSKKPPDRVRPEGPIRSQSGPAN